MPIETVKPGEIPESVLGDLKTLMPDKFEYVAVGRNIYKLYPTPAMKLLELTGMFIGAMRDLRDRMLEELKQTLPEEDYKKIEPTFTPTYMDMVADEHTRQVLIKIAQEALEGADPADVEIMTAGQLADLLAKLIKVNLDTVPASIRQQLFGVAPQLQQQENAQAEETAKNP